MPGISPRCCQQSLCSRFFLFSFRNLAQEAAGKFMQRTLRQGTAQFQTGLSGVVAGVSGMEAYSDRTRLVNAGYSNEDTLAGAGGIDRRILYRTKMQRGTKSAGALGLLCTADRPQKPDGLGRISDAVFRSSKQRLPAVM